MKILVTGASGFVGSQLCETLREKGHEVRAVLRPGRPVPAGAAEHLIVDDIGPTTDWSAALSGLDAIVHLAARAHVMNDSPYNRDRYIAINAEGTRVLAQAALFAGVRRFVFLSSIKVNGERTTDQPFRHDDPPRPKDPYGESKWLAERNLHALVARGLQPTIVRPPLVYGRGVRANFRRLMGWVDRGLPLPLGAIRNSRSLVSTWNLCDFVAHSLTTPRAASQTFLVSDGEDLSTPDLISRLATAMGRRARLVAVPPSWLAAAAGMVGRRAEVDRLCESLRVDITETRTSTGWSPPLSVNEGLVRTVRSFVAHTAGGGES